MKGCNGELSTQSESGTSWEPLGYRERASQRPPNQNDVYSIIKFDRVSQGGLSPREFWASLGHIIVNVTQMCLNKLMSSGDAQASLGRLCYICTSYHDFCEMYILMWGSFVPGRPGASRRTFASKTTFRILHERFRGEART